MKKSLLMIVLLICLIGCSKKDSIAPVLSFTEIEKNIVVVVGSNFDLKKGFVATDNIEKDISNRIKIKLNGFDINVIGKYNLEYSVKDKDGNISNIITREITVRAKDTIPPLILTDGVEQNVVIEINTKYDLINGIIALDNLEDDITNKIIIENNDFDSSKIGNYKINYTVQDSDGNGSAPFMREIIVIDSANVKYVAHRGGKGYGLENTLEAFQAAINNKYYGIEYDIQTTKDKVMVVYHDLNLKRLTGIDANIKDCEYSSIKNLTLTKIEDSVTYTGKIPTFKDLLTMVKNSDVKLFTELKETFTIEDVQIMLNDIKESQIPLDRFVIIANSSSLDILVSLRQQYPTLKLQFVARTDWKNYMKICLDNNIDLDISIDVYSSEETAFKLYINRFKDKNLEVNVWVLNKQNDVRKYLTMGVNYITTDILK